MRTLVHSIVFIRWNLWKDDAMNIVAWYDSEMQLYVVQCWRISGNTFKWTILFRVYHNMYN